MEVYLSLHTPLSFLLPLFAFLPVSQMPFQEEKITKLIVMIIS